MVDDDIQAPQNVPDSNTTPEEAKDTKTPEEAAAEAFKERGNFFIREFDEKLEQEDIKIALAIIIDPQHKQPIVYTKGNTYQLTRVLVDFARYFKDRLNQELEI